MLKYEPEFFLSMARGKIGGFLVHSIILVVLFLSLIQIVFSFHHRMFLGELVLLVSFILIAFFFMAGKLSTNNWSNAGLLLLYGLILGDLIFIWAIDARFAVGTIIIAAIGFIIALFSFRNYQKDYFDDDFEEIEPADEEKSEVTTSFEPGKYLASKTGKKFHIPKCDWAKRIKKKSQVWLNDKDEAKKKGYKACDCIK